MIRTQNPDGNPDKQLSAPVRIFCFSKSISRIPQNRMAGKIYKIALTLHNM